MHDALTGQGCEAKRPWCAQRRAHAREYEWRGCRPESERRMSFNGTWAALGGRVYFDLRAPLPPKTLDFGAPTQMRANRDVARSSSSVLDPEVFLATKSRRTAPTLPAVHFKRGRYRADLSNERGMSQEPSSIVHAFFSRNSRIEHESKTCAPSPGPRLRITPTPHPPPAGTHSCREEVWHRTAPHRIARANIPPHRAPFPLPASRRPPSAQV